MQAKTHIVRTLPCGCKEARYLFGRTILRKPTCWIDHEGKAKQWQWPPSASGADQDG